MEYYKARKINLQNVFIDFKKAYENVPRGVIWVGNDKEEYSQPTIKNLM